MSILRLSSNGEQAHFCAVLLNVMLAHGLPTAMLLVRLSRALAVSLDRLLDDTALRKAMTVRASQKVEERFHAQRTAERTLDLMKGLVRAPL